ncbi:MULTISPECIES: efflux transporter outer membrane subunit [Burkholderia]|uniref:Multidrug transporter n=1 Tax=Burkholderia paludis TaxID=1506587 RepID=A0A6J5F8D0_9BURK|nr:MULTISPECIES: efflux transporter outer membrane subunit [Burkholderia]CAB3773505.1 putative efflux pump outer membrane protein TtgC [Burkholderia paludis]VWC28663.1 multidrug transporter [Burkholderia paludis]
MNMLKKVSILCGIAVLSACSLIPEYTRPNLPVKDQWPSGQASASAGLSAPDVAWQDFFSDGDLRKVIAAGLANNHDLRRAALTVMAYRAQYQIQRSNLAPQVGAGASASIQRLPRDLAISGQPGMQNQYTVDVGLASYEVDLFGKIRSLTQAELEQYLASGEARQSVQISLIGEIAKGYFTWRTDQQLEKLSSATLSKDEDTLRLVERNAERGVSSRLEVYQSRTRVDRSRAQVIADSRNVTQDRNALEFLIGTSLPDGLAQEDPLERPVIPDLPIGVPSTVLLRRPDIKAAEHRLLAANADIGAARAAFFPSISLTASAGTTSAQLHNLFSGGQGLWTFAPQINVPIFSGGRLQANLDYAKVQKDLRVVDYEQAIQSAFRDVADGIAARLTYRDQLTTQASLVSNNEKYLNLAQGRFRSGISSYLTVLDAQRELFSSQQALKRDRLAQLLAEVSLYKSLGGGLKDNEAAEVKAD